MSLNLAAVVDISFMPKIVFSLNQKVSEIAQGCFSAQFGWFKETHKLTNTPYVLVGKFEWLSKC